MSGRGSSLMALIASFLPSSLRYLRSDEDLERESMGVGPITGAVFLVMVSGGITRLPKMTGSPHVVAAFRWPKL